MSRRKNRRPRNRKATAATPDSVPMHFADYDLRGDDIYSRDKWLDTHHPLDFLSVDKVRTAMNAAARGAHAEVQWLWEKLEPADGYLATCVDRRAAALKKLPWSIRPKEGLSDIERTLAEAQCRTLQDFANALPNIDEAIAAMGQASFRGFKHLQLFVDDYGNMELVPTDNWNWCQRGYMGEWRWNPTANFGATEGEPLPCEPESIISRYSPRPIDQPAMLLALDRRNAKAQWMVFNGRYGTPPIFAVMPQGVDARTRDAYMQLATRCVSNAAGVLPYGSDIKTVSASTTGPDTFARIIDISNQEIVLRATGGLMTMLTAPGAGTTSSTGNTHQDAFDELAEAEGAEIAANMHDGIFAPCLDQWHPGQPELVEFVIERQASREASEAVTHITSLKAAGYQTSPEQLEELTGYKTELVETAPAAGMGGMAMNSRAVNYLRRYLPSTKWPPARAMVQRACNALSAASNQAEDSKEEIITPQERQLLEGILNMGLDPERLAQKTADYTEQLAAAIAPYAPKEGVLKEGEGILKEEEGVLNEEEDTATNAQPNNGSRTYKRDTCGQFSSTDGAQGQGRSREHQTHSPDKPATPLQETSQHEGRTIKSLQRAAKRVSQKGGVIKNAATVDGKPFNIYVGDDDHGLYHARHHYTKTLTQDVAFEALVKGEKSDAGNGKRKSEYKGVRVIYCPDGKDAWKMVTAYKIDT